MKWIRKYYLILKLYYNIIINFIKFSGSIITTVALYVFDII